MHRFFIEPEDVRIDDFIMINNIDSVNHMSKVLRVKLGEQIEIVSRDTLIIGEVTAINHEVIKIKILSEKPHENESSIHIDLFQCLPKGQKLELILQKNVELGVHDFYLVQSKRCIVDYKPKDMPKKIERLSKIVKEASKQSKRDRIPEIFGVINLKEVAAIVSNYDQFLILYEGEQSNSLKGHLKTLQGDKVAVFIGPEGGLDQAEVELLVNSGAMTATLGKRILRTETAGFVAVSCIQYEKDALG